jgi:hypothetical protein
MKHIDEHDLERYHMGSVQEPESTCIEEHLLWCQTCLDRIEETGRFVDAMRAGAIRGGFENEFVAQDRPRKGVSQ